MNTQQKRGIAADGISDEAVSHYLESHPDFFERHSGLLGTLQLPHTVGGSAVSLIERQVAILRGRNAKLERKLQDLVAFGRSNDALASKIHNLSKALISAEGADGVIDAVERSLSDDFGAERAVLLLLRQAQVSAQLPEGGLVRALDRNDPGLVSYSSILEAAGPRCGHPNESQREFLFGESGGNVRSAALVPLGGQPRIGILAVGSDDPDRFLPTMSVDFLTRIGDLVTHAIATRAA